MRKFRLLIVDDEALIREGLRARIAYFDFPDLDVSEAGSGREALEAFCRENIDLALVDIAMPDMNGLELISRAKAAGSGARFLLLSGYAEFAYAQEAITLGVRAYLNKPVSNDVLRENIEGLLNELRQEEQHAPREHPGEDDCARELNMLFAGGWRDVRPEQIFPALAQSCPELFSGASWLCPAILHIDPRDGEDAEDFFARLNAVRIAVRDLLAETPCEGRCIIALSDVNPKRLHCLFVHPDRARLRKQVEQTFLTLRQDFGNRMNARVTMGAGRLTRALTADCAMDARAALRQRRMYGRSNVYFFDDIAAYETQPFPEAELEILRRNMVRGDRAGILLQLENLFSEKQMEGRKEVYLHVLWVRVVSLMMGVFHDMDAATMNRLLTLVSRVESMTGREEILRTLTELTDVCLRQGSGRELSAMSKIEQAIGYIREHYSEDIVINDLAARLDMSPSYFSSTFKKEMGQSTMQYITALRVDRAREYLTHSRLSVAAIAKNVGYEDSQYFFRVFKKATGMTPLQYRQNPPLTPPRQKNEDSPAKT